MPSLRNFKPVGNHGTPSGNQQALHWNNWDKNND